MFRWMREHVSCQESVKHFVRVNSVLLSKLEQHLFGRPLSIRCDRHCTGSTNGFYNANVPEIVLCERGGMGEWATQEAQATLHHELIHATESILDDLDTNGKIDFDICSFLLFRLFLVFSDPESLACSEVRAAHWANCDGSLFFVRSCTRSRAIDSVSHHLSASHAALLVDAVFERCYDLPDPTRSRQ